MNRLFLTISVRFLFILSIFWQFPNALFAQTNPENPFEYKIVKSISLPGDEKWDYLAVNERYNRLFIAHTSQVQVVDLKKDSLIATIPNLQGVHGIAFAEDLDLGFTSNGKSSTVTVFDLKTLQVPTPMIDYYQRISSPLERALYIIYLYCSARVELEQSVRKYIYQYISRSKYIYLYL